MREYCPDRWVLLKVTHPEFGASYKILASWYGGFGGSNSWKLSSGTVKVDKDPEFNQYHLLQHTGSTYIVSPENYGTSGYTGMVLQGWLSDLADKPELGSIEVMDENFDLASIPVL